MRPKTRRNVRVRNELIFKETPKAILHNKPQNPVMLSPPSFLFNSIPAGKLDKAWVDPQFKEIKRSESKSHKVSRKVSTDISSGHGINIYNKQKKFQPLNFIKCLRNKNDLENIELCNIYINDWMDQTAILDQIHISSHKSNLNKNSIIQNQPLKNELQGNVKNIEDDNLQDKKFSSPKGQDILLINHVNDVISPCNLATITREPLPIFCSLDYSNVPSQMASAERFKENFFNFSEHLNEENSCNQLSHLIDINDNNIEKTPDMNEISIGTYLITDCNVKNINYFACDTPPSLCGLTMRQRQLLKLPMH